MSPQDFVIQYAQALRSQSWAAVDPLIHSDACVTFSNGAAHRGKAAVRVAYERNFAAIKNEDYRVSNVHWFLEGPDTAAYLFDFHWTGLVRGALASGAGRGTALLIKDDGVWRLLAEHLGPKPKSPA